MASTSAVSVSTNADINGLLSGIKWTNTALTFSFPTDPSQYSYTGEVATFGVFSAAAQAVVKNQVLANYAAVSGLTFTQVTETSTTHGTLRYADSDSPSTAWAYYPSTGDWGGDVWTHKSGNAGLTYDNPVKGNYAYHTFLHETGHALGLKHGQETSGAFNALPTAHDSMEYSVMTYRGYVGAPLTGYTNETWGFAQSLMQDDVAAIQYMYGANWTTNSGNSVYTWSATTGEMFINCVGQGAPGGNKVFLNIWDGGGIDTYDFSARTTAISVDLRPGGWVNLGTQLVNLGAGHIAIGNISNSLLYQGDVRSLIENANGGSGNDTFIGNQANNVFNGGAGTDTVTYASLTTGINMSVDASGNLIVNAGTAGGIDTLIAVENVVGTSGNDVLMGNALNNTLNGGAGIDTVSYANATTGVTVMLDGTGAATVSAGALGTDTLLLIENVTGGAGNDTFGSNTSNNVFNGGAGSDTVTYAGYTAAITVSANADGSLTVKSGTETDTLIAIENITGGSGNDMFIGTSADNVLNGGLGTDTVNYSLATGVVMSANADGSLNAVVTGGGVDTLISIENITTGAGNDTLMGNAANNVLNGGLGNDTVSYANATAGVTVTLDANGNATVNAGVLGIDTLVSIENVTGGLGADTLTGNALANSLGGGDGADRLFGGDGNDTLLGDAATSVIGGADTLYGDAGDDTLYGYAGNDSLFGGVGNDYLYGGDGVDRVDGGAGNDVLYGGAGNDIIFGGLGNDTIYGGIGFDTFQFDTAGVGKEMIWDFAGGFGLSDSLLFKTTVFANEAAVRAHAIYAGGNTTISTATGGFIVLVGVNIADLKSDDFAFF
jgi:serralysin